MKKIDIRLPREQLVKAVEISCGLNAYRETLNLAKIETEEYQKNYISYYRVRRDKLWLKEYFSYMQSKVGSQNIKFEEILSHISNVAHKTKNGSEKTIEASFASKMLATLNPNYPIWDARVAKAVGMKYDNTRKIKEYVDIYGELTENVKTFLLSNDGIKCVEEFDRMFPNFIDINPVKKIDMFLWQMGK